MEGGQGRVFPCEVDWGRWINGGALGDSYMRFRGRKLLAVALLGLVALGGMGAAGAYILVTRLPAPENADQDQLLRWLVTRDLSQEPVALRLALARRLEEESRRGVNWDATASRLSKAQRRRLWQNLPVLLEPWFLEKVDGYFALADGEQVVYLDRVIDTVRQWRGVDNLQPDNLPDDAPGASPSSLMIVLCQRIEDVRKEAEPDRQQRLGQFVTAVQTRWFVRVLQEVLPGPRSSSMP